jgi:hypothetical protein
MATGLWIVIGIAAVAVIFVVGTKVKDKYY